MAVRIAAILVLIPLVAIEGQLPQAPGPFRRDITVVPVDVRVFDRSGRPVTDLTRDDFIVSEDDVPQVIQHFSVQAMEADPAASPVVALHRGAAGEAAAPQNRRLFLMMLGRGRHQAVSKSLTALEEFVRTRLLPQDAVALIAFNRATDFTTDHELIAQTISRYRQRHERIDTGMNEWFSGLRAVYGSREIPPHIQREIDAVFDDAGRVQPREVTPGQVTSAGRLARDLRQTADDLLNQQIASERPADSQLKALPGAEEAAEWTGVTFDEFAQQAVETWHNLGMVYAAIDYVRHLEGEKHLVMFTSQGLNLYRKEDSIAVATLASDARVALHTVQTGGAGPALATRGMAFNSSFSVQDLRLVAELTGGRASSFEYGDRALERIDQSTRFHYLLGYSPANPVMDGKLRKITVRVRRPGLTVVHRGSYFARHVLEPLDRRQMVTSNRVYAAGQYHRTIEDIRVSVQPRAMRGEGSAPAVALDMKVDISRIAFKYSGGRHAATLDVAVFFGDARQRVVGEAWQKVELALTPELLERHTRERLPVTLQLPIPAEARHAKIVVYDYGSDLLGTAASRLPGR
jgi:VWFA-related protein